MYAIKEIYYTIQGEGARAGTPAVFCRFAGCNLWSGREADRGSAICRFCDTDFWGTDGRRGGVYRSAAELADSIRACGPCRAGDAASPWVVCTGGEPLLQLDATLVAALHERAYRVAIETNGTLPNVAGVDWTCVSPKAGTELVLRRGDELKLVYPQEGLAPEDFADLDFEHFFLQPMDGPELERSARACVDYCLAHPPWKLSVQTHKLIGID